MLEMVREKQPAEERNAEQEFKEILAETDRFLKLQSESMRKASVHLLEPKDDRASFWRELRL